MDSNNKEIDSDMKPKSIIAENMDNNDAESLIDPNKINSVNKSYILPLYSPKPYSKPTLVRVKSVQAPESPTTKSTTSPFDEETHPIEITPQKRTFQRSKSIPPPIAPKPDMSKFLKAKICQ